MDFAGFKTLGAAQEITSRMGLDLGACVSWDDLTFVARATDDFADRARRLHGRASSGERPLVAAILTAVDYGWLADELSDGRAWQCTESCSGEHRRAMAAAVAREC